MQSRNARTMKAPFQFECSCKTWRAQVLWWLDEYTLHRLIKSSYFADAMAIPFSPYAFSMGAMTVLLCGSISVRKVSSWWVSLNWIVLGYCLLIHNCMKSGHFTIHNHYAAHKVNIIMQSRNARTMKAPFQFECSCKTWRAQVLWWLDEYTLHRLIKSSYFADAMAIPFSPYAFSMGAMTVLLCGSISVRKVSSWWVSLNWIVLGYCLLIHNCMKSGHFTNHNHYAAHKVNIIMQSRNARTMKAPFQWRMFL